MACHIEKVCFPMAKGGGPSRWNASQIAMAVV